MQRVAEQIADWLVEQGIEQVFAVTGGGAMFLNQAFASHPKLKCTYMHHEQACAMAAEGYARISGKPAVVNVTTGPGGINALNGVFGAYTDSIPMLVISGQVKRDTLLDYKQVEGLRQLGDQEAPVAAMARPVTKSANVVLSTAELAVLLPKALHECRTGRPGPVWLDIPLDIQSATEPVAFQPAEIVPEPKIELPLAHIHELLSQAQRPVLLGGTGVRLAGAQDALLALAERRGIPLATAWTHDLIASDHPLFAGRPGTIGTRAGNFAVQNADLVIVIGSRLNIRQVSYNWPAFAKNATVVHVDIDPAELSKPIFNAHVPVAADARDFVLAFDAYLATCPALPDYSPWAQWCVGLRTRYPVLQPHHLTGERINPYQAIDFVFRHLRHDDIVVCGNASACIIPFQTGHLTSGQRMFSNSGSASMGYDLPAALGAAIAAPQRRVICFAGDGSLQMNIQELQTLRTLQLNVIVVVIDNNGYLSIKQTHENFFGQIVGAHPDSGVDFPDFTAIAGAYGLPAQRIAVREQFDALHTMLQQDGPQLIQLEVDSEQSFEPRLKSRMGSDGTFHTPELDDMFPFIAEAELEAVRAEALAIHAIPRKETHHA
ncbi:acetolactate synthase-1/2/3 large subunit [Andreprevotia lacus DSM 23236]|uniref:Acetolactate synthase-1/2/3 large subunit n=1 Tax=Andreprevotia lacus DSM 23236 TaxID=1121001 RepID=A0A1W1Y0Z6_9NEIS|nr:thiamine pyrophosphate-binding protein [Andreprevotia lacus]SMC29805.1 acetolactate synthase-1/2/3 large subunit [Andreprevotia lacus DSM 23236]